MKDPVSCVVNWSSCRNNMLKQEELTFINAISTVQLSPTGWHCLEGRSSQWCLLRAGAPRLEVWLGPPSDHLVSSRASAKSTNWQARATCLRPQQEPSIWSLAAPLHATSPAVTGDQTPFGSRQLGTPDGGVTYAAVLACPVARFRQVGHLGPQLWDQTCPNPLSRQGHRIGACLATCSSL